jgi:hypothetical protein
MLKIMIVSLSAVTFFCSEGMDALKRFFGSCCGCVDVDDDSFGDLPAGRRGVLRAGIRLNDIPPGCVDNPQPPAFYFISDNLVAGVGAVVGDKSLLRIWENVAACANGRTGGADCFIRQQRLCWGTDRFRDRERDFYVYMANPSWAPTVEHDYAWRDAGTVNARIELVFGWLDEGYQQYLARRRQP